MGIRKNQILKVVRSQRPVVETALIHSIDGKTAAIRIGSSTNVMRNVECVGGTGNLYPGLKVNIAWVDNRPIVLASAEGSIGPMGRTGPQGAQGEVGPQGEPGPAGSSAGIFTPGGRLSLVSGVPFYLSDQAAKNTVYYTPYLHNYIMLNDGTAWNPYEFSELTLLMTSGYSSGYNYDVFCCLNNGNPALEALVWTGNQSRATALVFSSGRYVKSGDPTRLYLGTFRTSADNLTEDSQTKRFLWNMYNRESKHGLVTGLSGNADSYALGSTYFIIGHPYGQSVHAGISANNAGTTATYCAVYLMYDGSTNFANALTECGLGSAVAVKINAGASAPANFSTGYHYVSLGLNVQTTAAVMNNGRVWFQMEM